MSRSEGVAVDPEAGHTLVGEVTELADEVTAIGADLGRIIDELTEALGHDVGATAFAAAFVPGVTALHDALGRIADALTTQAAQIAHGVLGVEAAEDTAAHGVRRSVDRTA
ncbi:hypothetical protein ABLE94_04935 [Gordonia sp. VNK1]|uniref:hypothetical protein n=1 Tax=Gordonia oleivorans TaxID=3156618 RepID=UPI0032B5642A